MDENLGTYWQVISESDRKRWFAKEVHLRSRFGIKLLDDEQLDKLKSTRTGQKVFSDDFNFDMLADRQLQEELYFTDMEYRFENKTSDFVAQALYLGEDRLDN